jgi:hypothetical protein
MADSSKPLHQEIYPMKNQVARSLLSITLAATCLLSSQAAFASPLAITPLHAKFGGTKMIQLSLRNTTSTSMELKVGDNLMTIDPGKTVSVKVPTGTRITANTATKTHEAGQLIVQVSGELNGATLAIS